MQYHTTTVLPQSKQNHKSYMFWGSFAGDRKGRRIDEHMDGGANQMICMLHLWTQFSADRRTSNRGVAQPKQGVFCNVHVRYAHAPSLERLSGRFTTDRPVD
ncbi:uncharacterized protein N7515_001323 [Penicillium bovifimosum]|uniref:Uncharacterized protein n=1 Tax=Penicillium bovifimosum TaxID=126998 RepID=A0A9W9HB97_9EURO|nr:uncharacterized protein N7515_001323 [Penicillium bovifimosum]KAJ5142536.1 hypothetical protein N7515_001323 [Penicillium bovifimosum]